MDCGFASRKFFKWGPVFAKWRAVISIGEGIPSRSCIEANAQALARYARVVPGSRLVPIVEPEVLMDGDHTLECCRKVTEEVLRTFFIQLNCQRWLLEGMILKPNMVLPGLNCPVQESADEGRPTSRCIVCCEPSPPLFRVLLSCRAANPVNWPRAR